MDPKIFQLLAIFIIQQHYISEGAPLVPKSIPFLLPVDGYNIPVHIRVGDTPLEEIDVELAEAFRSFERKQARVAANRQQHLDGRSPNVLLVSEEGVRRINDKLAEEADRIGKETETKGYGKPQPLPQPIAPKKEERPKPHEPEPISLVPLEVARATANAIAPPKHAEPIYHQIPKRH